MSTLQPPPRRARADSPEVAALRVVAARQPALASAVDMQIELLSCQRRVESRLSTPWVEFDAAAVGRDLAAGRPLIRFEHIPFEWTEFRLLFRQLTDLLHRFEMVEDADYRALQQAVRAGRPDDGDVARWYADGAPRDGRANPGAEAISQVLELAVRPFLARVVATTSGRVDVSAWRRPFCPFCGGAPEMAVWSSDTAGMLACGRCSGVWATDPRACAHCGNTDSATLSSFASADGIYRLAACDRCRRYIKAYDVSQGGRPLMLPVDAIATLPLDAAAQQRGYQP